MRERATLLGGGVEVASPPSGGTLVRAWLPALHVMPESP
jgi:signal transduction histidine kinase